MFEPIMQVLGWVINFFYDIVGNYGVSIILFTITIKIILFPLMIRQQKSMLQMQKMQPQIKELQEKHKENKEALNKDVMKLYKDNKINPMGGCLLLFIQLPIIFCLYFVIRKPVTYMLGIDYSNVWHLAYALNDWFGAHVNTDLISVRTFDTLKKAVEMALAGVWKPFGQAEIDIACLITKAPEILASVPIFGNIKPIDFNFLWLDLSRTPSISVFDWFWVFPALSAVTTYLSTKVMPQRPDPDNSEQAQAMRNMNYIFPFMTAWFAFQLPSAVSLYWVVSNILQIFQQLWVNRFFGLNEK